MNRIEQKFKDLRKEKRKAFIAFITAGDPSLTATEELVYAFEKSGVDIVELGVPFSDPIADGPTIQAASQRALEKGVTLDKIITLVEKIRKKSDIPICLMMYYNQAFHYGEERFVKRLKSAGVDGLVIPDLPPEEAKNLISASKKHKLATVFFVAPTTTKERVKKIAAASTGFIYFVSVTGVTGARQKLPAASLDNLKTARKMTSTPVCVGFGVSTPEQVKKMAAQSDGVIVGSAIINTIQKHAGKKDLVVKTAAFVRKLTASLKG